LGGYPETIIGWDSGTAYDFFFSLYVLHAPEKFGLRASWAAGVRSRLSNEERKTLLDAQRVVNIPLCWIYSLQGPRDAETALWTLKNTPPEERLPILAFCDGKLKDEAGQEYQELVKRIASQGKWSEQDLDALRDIYREKGKETTRSKELRMILDVWADCTNFGTRYYEALQSYYRAFYAEEEKRILPALNRELKRAQELSNQLDLPELIEELSRGIRFQESLDVSELVLIPSFWLSPLIYFSKYGDDKMLVVFGGRPSDSSIVPGEQVPDPILIGLKALSDPTRLRILRYLTHENLTPTELARKLRLRAPTVTHHLQALRLAGLVHVTVGAEHVNRYTSRLESIEELFVQINDYLASESNGREDVES
jgi:DNA-binding transcriptional ArsR family regulator